MVKLFRPQLLCGALCILSILVQAVVAQEEEIDVKAGVKKLAVPKFTSGRAHDNHGLTIETTHEKVKMDAGHISHFDHHSISGALASHAHMFNIFRLIGDFSHVASFAFLLLRLNAAHSCAGISLKTQELYLAVFICRYLDLFTNFISLYNTIMKILFIGTTVFIVYMMRVTLKESLAPEPEGTQQAQILVPICAVLAIILNDHNVSDSYFACFQSFMWAFSIYLEAIAIIPQMVLLKRKKVVENITANYIVALGIYRAMYLVNWAYRYLVDPVSGIEFIIKVSAGLVQTGLYVQFFRLYLSSRKSVGIFGGDVVMDSKGLI